MVVAGTGLTTEKAEAAFSKAVKDLAPDESAWLYVRCQTYKPSMNAVAVTNHRVLGIVNGPGNNRVVLQAAHDELIEVAHDAAERTLTLRTSSREMQFKRMAAEDVEAVVHYMNEARRAAMNDDSMTTPGAPMAWDSTANAAVALRTAAQGRATVYGHRADPAKVAKQVPTWSLLDSEHIWLFAKCNNISPALDGLVLTNARILGVIRGSGVKFMASYPSIATTESDAIRGQVMVTLNDGRSFTFKGLHAADVGLVATALQLADGIDRDPDLTSRADGVAEEYRRKHAPTQEEVQVAKDKKRQDRLDERERKAAAATAAAAEDMARYGACIYDGVFGAKTIRLYDKGYVRVAFLALGSKAPYERLVDIQTSVDVQKKSGAGRAVGGLLTMGVSLAASNKRGDIWITVVTDGRSHTLHEDPPTVFNIAQAKKIAGVGQSIVKRAENPIEGVGQRQDAGASEVSSQKPDLADRLRRIESLRDEGLISADEYQLKREQLLDEIYSSPDLHACYA